MRIELTVLALTLTAGCKVSQDDVVGPGDSAADTDVLDTDESADTDGAPPDSDARDSSEDTDVVDTDATSGADTDAVDTDALDTDVADTNVVDTDLVDTDLGDTDVGDTDVAPFCGDGRLDPGEECDDIYDYFPGDGCTGCVVDPYWYCWGEPSYCVVL